MRKTIIALIVAPLLFSLLSFPSHAYENPEDVLKAHYAADLSGDMEMLLATYNIGYIEAYLANYETFKSYVAAEKSVYTTLSSSLTNIASQLSEDGSMALLSYDVTGELKVNETGETIPISKKYGAFLNNTTDGWKINFIMDFDLMSMKMEMGALSLTSAIVDSIAEDSLMQSQLLNDSYNQPLVKATEAIASLTEFNKLTEEAVKDAKSQASLQTNDATTLNENSTEETPEYDFEAIIAAQKKAHMAKTVGRIVAFLVVAAGIGLALFVVIKKKKANNK